MSLCSQPLTASTVTSWALLGPLYELPVWAGLRVAGTGHGASLPEMWALSAHSGSPLRSEGFPDFAHWFKLLLLGSAQPISSDPQVSATASKTVGAALRADRGCVLQLLPVHHLQENKHRALTFRNKPSLSRGLACCSHRHY